MSGSKRGRAVIISVEYFTDSRLDDRQGNKTDVRNLTQLLESLHFTVDTFTNKTDEVIENLSFSCVAYFKTLIFC